MLTYGLKAIQNHGGVSVRVKTKCIAVILCILVVFSISQVFLPVSYGVDTTNNRTYWLNLATKAWQFFDVGQAVNSQTGLHGAGLGWPYFTEWDLGTYIQAMIDARQLGILQDSGQWGFDYRIGKIIDFLKNRQLTSNNVPYLTYDSRTGEPYQDTPSFCIDEGKLYLALYNLKNVRPGLAEDINYIVKVRNNNNILVPNPQSWLNVTDFYCYYIASAFKAFQFEGWNNVPSSIIGTIVSQPKVTSNGVELPIAHICTEPLLETKFEVKPQDSRFDWLISQVSQAHEARYKATGHYTAFSEGNTGLTGSNDPSYVYEYVVDTDGSTWKVAPQITPIAYLKVAVGLDAIYNTAYTESMVEYLIGKLPSFSGGFPDGVAENGRVVDTHIDRTNGLIISAARYVIENIPAPTPIPTTPPPSTPTPTPPPTPTPTASPTIAPSLSPSFSESPTPPVSSSPSFSTSPPPTSIPSSSPSVSESPTPSVSSSPSSSYSASPTPSISSSPSLSFPPSPTISSSPNSPTNNNSDWYTQPITIVAIVLIACLLSAFLLVMRFKKYSFRGILRKA